MLGYAKPLFALVNYCMNFFLTVLHTFFRSRVAQTRKWVCPACIPAHDGSTSRKMRGGMADTAMLLQQRCPWWASTMLLIGPCVHASAHFWMSARIDPLKGHWGASQLLSEDDLHDCLPVYLFSGYINQIETKCKPWQKMCTWFAPVYLVWLLQTWYKPFCMICKPCLNLFRGVQTMCKPLKPCRQTVANLVNPVNTLQVDIYRQNISMLKAHLVQLTECLAACNRSQVRTLLGSRAFWYHMRTWDRFARVRTWFAKHFAGFIGLA